MQNQEISKFIALALTLEEIQGMTFANFEDKCRYIRAIFLKNYELVINLHFWTINKML